MYNYIKQFLNFLFPVLKSTALQITADALYELSDSRRRRPGYRRPARTAYTSYNRLARPYSGPTRDIFEKPRTEREAIRNVGRAVREADELKAEQNRFHDVLMVAFDITGPNEAVVHEFLARIMPPAKEYRDQDINIDSWWIADDGGDSDCDSAVFVTKGKQAAAREVLREYGLVE